MFAERIKKLSTIKICLFKHKNELIELLASSLNVSISSGFQRSINLLFVHPGTPVWQK